MSAFGIVFLLVNAIALLSLPRRWAPLPLLVGACYMTLGQEIEVGPLHFTVIRILVAVGLLRVIMRGERIAGRTNALDLLMVLWAAWALMSSFFHEQTSAALVYRLGLVYNACGLYFLLRVLCRSMDDVIALCRVTAILLAPLAVLMLVEKMTGHNLFSALGGVSALSELREGRIRAQGPFAHPILAGTVGAACLPLMVGLWRQHRRTAIAGILACGTMIIACASSGPILGSLAAAGALCMWRWRHRMRLVRWMAVLGYIGLDLVMKAPAYYLISRIDLAGGSTSWHRAFLIDAALNHISEWWFAGTDYTRHWIDYGVGWTDKHVDITNHYVQMGIWGGLPLMFLFLAILARGFRFVGQWERQRGKASTTSGFMVWSLGASLFSHATSFISISYFDQSVVFIYLTLAAISAVSAEASLAERPLREQRPVRQGPERNSPSRQRDPRLGLQPLE